MEHASEHSPEETWGSISEYLDRALDLTDAELEIWLTELRAREPQLAAQLQQLLAQREREGFADFLGAGTSPLAGIETGTLIGRRIGAYQIEAEAGRGGMGSVWRARRVDGRYEGVVAIKLVHAAWLGQGAAERFCTEGQLLGRLEHPHIARLLDAGVADSTQPYLVLEYVEGGPIDEYCRQHALGIGARIRLFLDVLQAVAHAHSHLVVHRDLKPGNIYVTHDGVVKLLDFGVAKLLQGDGVTSALTQSGQTALTPQYAAPEQLTGQAVTTATDIYTLGLVLYVLLTGTSPFPADSESRAQFIQAVLTLDPPRPSTVGAIETIPRRALRGDLDNILSKALKKDPLERYRSVTDFADDLERLLGHEPVHAHADTVGYRVSKFVRRHRGGVLGALLTTIALVGTTAFALYQLQEARAQRDLANFEAARASAQNEMNEFLMGDSVGQAPHEVAVRRLERARALIHQRFSDNPMVQARLLINLSGRYIDVGDSRGGAAVMQDAEAIAKKLDDPHLSADIACGRGEDAVAAGDLAAAHAQEAVGRANMQRLKVVPSGLVAECAIATAHIAQSEGDYAHAVAVTREAMLPLEKAGLQRTSRYTSLAHEHARSLVLAGDYRNAWAAEQAVMAIVTSVGRDNSAPSFAMLNVGLTALLNGGQPRRALEVLESAEARGRSAAPSMEFPFYLDATRLLAQSAAGVGPMADKGLMEHAATAEQQGMGFVILFYRIAALRAALERGDVATAENYWSYVSPMEANLGDASGRRNAMRALIAHATLDLARHDTVAASQHTTQAIALIPAARRGAEPEWRRLLLVRAQIEYALAQYAAAASDADAAVARARQEAVDPQSSAWIGEALVWRARAELAQGKRDAARTSAQEAIPHLQQNLDPSHPLIAGARGLAVETTIMRGSLGTSDAVKQRYDSMYWLPFFQHYGVNLTTHPDPFRTPDDGDAKGTTNRG
jgi:serine/threonine-protein kinase